MSDKPGPEEEEGSGDLKSSLRSPQPIIGGVRNGPKPTLDELDRWTSKRQGRERAMKS